MDLKKEILINETYGRARKNFTRRKTIMRGIGDTHQIDLMDLQKLARFNNGYKYILTVIDIFSKLGWCIPLKTKGGKEVTMAYETILQQGFIPKNVHSDAGTEFFNQFFKQLMAKYNINHFKTFSAVKASIAERFIQTIKHKLWKKFALQGSYKYLNILKDVVDEYNHTKHHTTSLRPVDVNKKNEEKLLKTVYNKLKIFKKSKFKVGDKVRISKYKSIFEKGYEPNWSYEIFKIRKIQNTNPKTYLLEDYLKQPIEGGFYNEELLLTKVPDFYLVEKVLKTKGDKVYVKWLGFDSTHNSWVSKKDVFQ